MINPRNIFKMKLRETETNSYLLNDTRQCNVWCCVHILINHLMLYALISLQITREHMHKEASTEHRRGDGCWLGMGAGSDVQATADLLTAFL